MEAAPPPNDPRSSHDGETQAPPVRVLVCPTAFKGTLSAAEAAAAMARGVETARPSAAVRRLPLSDGGPGLLDSLSAAEHAPVRRAPGVAGPAGGTTEGRVLELEDGHVAVVESADACGLALLAPEDRNPLRTHTRGVGDLLREAVDPGTSTVVVGLGGSATCDGGVGAARRFGYRFLDDGGGAVGDGGGALTGLTSVRPPGAGARRAESGPPDGAGPETGDGAGVSGVPELLALADVDNPLVGPDGAAATYAPQKGAGPRAVKRLDAGLRRLVEVAARDLEADPARVRAASERPGAGAAGGLAFGLEVFLGARVVGGTSWVARRVGLGDALARADLVVTGEGAYDRTTDRGKVVGEVIRRSRGAGIPVRLVCGRIEGELPDGVRGLDGGGRLLDGEAVAELTARALHGGAGPTGPPAGRRGRD